MTQIETIIIGGGISGLYTAMHLHQQNIPFILLEAKPTLGGRILSKPSIQHNHPSTDLSVDLGPTWFWPHQHKIQHLLAQLNVEWFHQYTQGDVLYQLNNSAQISRTSAGMAMESYRIQGGMQKLIEALTNTIPCEAIKTEHAVTQVKKEQNSWKILATSHNTTHTFKANRLIMAVPPRLITSTLTAEQYMSKTLLNALVTQQTWMSGQAKFVAVYNDPFWRKDDLSGQAYSQVGPMVEIHDASSSPESGAALFGFIGVPASVRKTVSQQQLTALCIKQLETIFGEQAANPNVTYLTDWAKDEWVATQHDINEAPQHAQFNYQAHETELQQLNLHFVATEFSNLEAGYLEGALHASDHVLMQIKSEVNKAY